MKSTILLSLVLVCSSQAMAGAEISKTTAPASESSFAQYIGGYKEPQLLQDNDQAFLARMKLLQQAPAGSEVQALTFMYDNGEVVRSLATQLCLASKRGLKVTLIADSKSGDRPLIPDVFDTSLDNRVNEESYQYMANCGVKVVIHNHLSAFNTLLSKTLPKVSSLNNDFLVLWKLRGIATQFIDILKEEIHSKEFKTALGDRLAKAGMSLEFLDALKTEAYRMVVAGAILQRGDKPRSAWRSVIATLAQYTWIDEGIKRVLAQPETAQTVFDMAVAGIYEKIASLDFAFLEDDDLASIKYRVQKRFDKLPELVEFYKNIRRFNRLNHRKLFVVESPAKKGCLILGGRNLGDHYLAWHHDSFIDGDVLYCTQHGVKNSALIADAKASFQELLDSSADDVLEEKEGAGVRVFKAVKGFRFKELIIPAGIEDGLSSRIPPYVDQLELVLEKRTLAYPIVFADQLPILGVPLAESSNWRIHRVAWQPHTANDPVRQALLKAINNEAQEIYIETAYAEFDAPLREAIENALRRGVDVRLITNGLFVSDGPSKLIRVFMALWLRDLQVEFAQKTAQQGKFSVQFATLEGGHMIHFKGASFKCQMSNERPYRTSMIGSHNYHPRSGYSDKEHALQWDQPAGEECLRYFRVEGEGSRAKDMADYRDAFYEKLEAKFDGNLLRAYPTLLAEFDHVISLEGKIPAERIQRAKALRAVIYRQRGSLRGGKATEFFLMYLRDSGARDFLGTIL